MSPIVVFALIVALPVALGYAVIGARRAHRRWLLTRAPLPAALPIERLAADLRRLHDQLDAVENAVGVPAKNLRCVAVRAAYLDLLGAACQQLQVRPPAGRPVPRTEIYRVESELRRAGLDVRPVR